MVSTISQLEEVGEGEERGGKRFFDGNKLVIYLSNLLYK